MWSFGAIGSALDSKSKGWRFKSVKLHVNVFWSHNMLYILWKRSEIYFHQNDSYRAHRTIYCIFHLNHDGYLLRYISHARYKWN